jgi:very-short-patch-repair endonuclease
MRSSPGKIVFVNRTTDTQLQGQIRLWNGVIPSRVLIEQGFSYRQLRDYCARGRLRRLRRGWLAAPGADVNLVRAAKSGGVLTCVTQATRLGLWVTQPDSSLHLGLPANSKRPENELGSTLHWNVPVVPRDPRSLVDTIVNVLATVALCLPEEDAFATWESALNKNHIELAELRRLPLTGRAKKLSQIVTPFSDSGLESFVLRRLQRVRVKARPQIWILGHHVDFLLGARLVLQIDGKTHVGRQRGLDNYHDAILKLNGYHVIRATYQQVMFHWEEVQDLIMRAIAQGLHLAT